MKIKNLVILLCLMPVVAFAADNSARVGMVRAGGVAQERPVPMRVPRGPFGIPLPLMPGPKTLCELRAGT